MLDCQVVADVKHATFISCLEWITCETRREKRMFPCQTKRDSSWFALQSVRVIHSSRRQWRCHAQLDIGLWQEMWYTSGARRWMYRKS